MAALALGKNPLLTSNCTNWKWIFIGLTDMIAFHYHHRATSLTISVLLHNLIAILFHAAIPWSGQPAEHHGRNGVVQTHRLRNGLGQMSLLGIQDVADIKEAIKERMAPTLDEFPIFGITIKATNRGR